MDHPFFTFFAVFIFTTFAYSTATTKRESIVEKLSVYSLAKVRQLTRDGKYLSRVETIVDKNLGAHWDEVSFMIDVISHLGNNKPLSNYKLTIDLHLNKELVASTFTQTLYDNGVKKVISTTKKDLHHCNYHGTVRGLINSRVAVSTCRGLSGFIDLGQGEVVHIEPLDLDHSTTHVIYRPDDHAHFKRSPTCGHDHLNTSASITDHFTGFLSNNKTGSAVKLRRKRSNNKNDRYFIETLIVMDMENYNRFKNAQERLDHIKAVVSQVDGYYKPLNFRVVLSHVEYWKTKNRVQMSTDAYKALDQFISYRMERLKVDADWRRTDVSHLLFGRNFEGTVIGMAHVGAMCGTRSGSVNQDLYQASQVSLTVAHEMGHNFGMHHDTTDCDCRRDYHCIMAPSATWASKVTWSGCSHEYLEQGIRLGLASCLMNVPDAGTLYGGPKCGNEIIEKGEECDCGSVQDCVSKCCNASTCMLNPGAECDSGSCCSSDTCQFQASGTLCRSSDNNECDLPEFCTGASPFCPGNVHRQDGATCNENDSCHDGVCLTLNMQCKIIWGEGATNGADQCYIVVNRQGNYNGNCGREPDGSFRRCKPEDAKCGKLNCHSKNLYPVSKGLESKMSYKNRVKYVTEACRTIASGKFNKTHDFDDSGMVQEGTGCGMNKVCQDNKCVDVEPLTCESKCNGRGICNNKGNCHCDVNWDPPYCKNKGRGGSVDSGPMTKNGVDKDMLLMVLLFVLVLPAVMISGAYIWYRFAGGKQQIRTWGENREMRLRALSAAEEEKERLAQVAEMKKRKGGGGGGGSFASSTSSLVANDNDYSINPSKLHGSANHLTTKQISNPQPVSTHSSMMQNLHATPRGSPRPGKPPPPRPTARPSPVPARSVPAPPTRTTPVKSSPICRPPNASTPPTFPTKPAPPPYSLKPRQGGNQLRSNGSQTPPPPPPPAANKPLGGARRAVSRPSTPIKPAYGGQRRGNYDDEVQVVSVRALKERFNNQV